MVARWVGGSAMTSRRAVVLRCEAPVTITLSNSGFHYNGKPRDELKAMLGFSEKFFLVAHVERGGDAYLKYSARYCERR